MAEQTPQSERAEELGEQIDALLDGMGPRSPDEAGESAPAAAGVTIDDQIEGDFHAPDRSMIEAATAANAGVAIPIEDPAPIADPVVEAVESEVSIGEVDQMLANFADDALDASFESVSEVLGEGGATDQEPPPEESVEEPFGEPFEETGQASLEGVATPEQEEAPDEAPAAVAAVAAEPVDASAPAGPTAEDVPRSPRPTLTERLKAADLVLRRILSVINMPAAQLEPQMRGTLGWVALAVAGPGLVMFLYGVIF